MEFNLTTCLFYFFALLTMFSSVMVISAKNPVYSVLYLIFAFFNVAGLFVLLGAEYIAMTLVIVYVGAVAVLFLFVVMMLNINYEKMREGFVKNLPTGVLFAFLFFVQLGAIFYAASLSPISEKNISFPTPSASSGITNTESIGLILYTDYAYAFQIAGLILLVGMIGAIVLTHRTRVGVRKQQIATQVYRTREESMEIVEVETGKGA